MTHTGSGPLFEAYLAEIRQIAFNFEPPGWKFCNGGLLHVRDYKELFAVIGATYGGDGKSTFALPDLRGRVPMGKGRDPVSADTNHVLGETGGQEEVKLKYQDLPRHTHHLRVNSSDNTPTDDPNGFLGPVHGGQALAYAPATGGTAILDGNSISITGAGRNASLPNMQPFLVINYIIAVQGRFPARS